MQKFMLKLKLVVKFFFNLLLPKGLKNGLLKFFGRDYELSVNELLNLRLAENLSQERGDFIVALTTFPARINELKYTLYSIFNQSLLPKKVILSLNTQEFRDTDTPINEEILALKDYGLEILWSNEDIRQYHKLVPVIKAFPNEVIVSLDDDIYYPKDLLRGLWEAYERDKKSIHCHRGRIINLSQNGESLESFSTWRLIKKRHKNLQNLPSFRIFLEGVGGVLYPPNSLYKDALNSELFMKLSPKADDLWFWAMAVLNGTKISVVADNLMANGNAMTLSPHGQSLWLENLTSGNDKQASAIVKHYPQILEILKSELD